MKGEARANIIGTCFSFHSDLVEKKDSYKLAHRARYRFSFLFSLLIKSSPERFLLFISELKRQEKLCELYQLVSDLDLHNFYMRVEKFEKCMNHFPFSQYIKKNSAKIAYMYVDLSTLQNRE